MNVLLKAVKGLLLHTSRSSCKGLRGYIWFCKWLLESRNVVRLLYWEKDERINVNQEIERLKKQWLNSKCE